MSSGKRVLENSENIYLQKYQNLKIPLYTTVKNIRTELDFQNSQVFSNHLSLLL